MKHAGRMWLLLPRELASDAVRRSRAEQLAEAMTAR
jgi:hypothetical protein